MFRIKRVRKEETPKDLNSNTEPLAQESAPVLPIPVKSEIPDHPKRVLGSPTSKNSVISGSRTSDGQHPMETLLKSGAAFSFLKTGDIVDGKVLEKKGTNVFVDLGPRGMGIVYGREYYAAQDIIKTLRPGDALSAKVAEAENEEGYAELSLKDAGEEKRWMELKKLMQEGKILELNVLEVNRGGLILEAEGVKGFLPVSQLSAKNYPRVEGGDKEKILQELQKFIGNPMRVKVIDLDSKEEKLIFAEADKILDEEASRSAVSRYKVGDEVEGAVTGVVDFGAFMRFGEAGLEGLIHISEIDWTLIANPRDILKPGDAVRAKIIDIQGDKISLSLKALKENPWEKAAAKYKKGDVVKGKVTKFNPFGAFVELGPVRSQLPGAAANAQAHWTFNGVQGLAHISEFGNETKMRQALELGKEYEFKVLMIDPQEHRMSLGMVRAASPEQTAEIRETGNAAPPPSSDESLGV